MKVNAKSKQYTIRGIKRNLDTVLRQLANRKKKSLNRFILESLEQIAGQEGGRTSKKNHDLDSLIDSWQEDPMFDSAILAQSEIDESLWK